MIAGMGAELVDVWQVEAVEEPPGRRRLSLVRSREHRVHGRLRTHTEVVDRTVFFSRSFRLLLDGPAMAHYMAVLGQIGQYAQAGEFGCFVQTRPEAGQVEISLYERWFDGAELHTDELARRRFDASEEGSLVASAEFLADLQIWAQQRNEQRDAAILEARDADQQRLRLTSEREAAGQELNRLLAAYTRRS